MKKKVVVSLLVLSTLLSGCGVEVSVNIKDDGTYTEKQEVFMTAEECLAVDKDIDLSSMGTIELNGKTYYTSDDYTNVIEGKWSEASKRNYDIQKDKFAYGFEPDGMVYDFNHIYVTVPYTIGYTNVEKINDNTVRVCKNQGDIFIAKDESVLSGKQVVVYDSKCNEQITPGRIFGIKDLIAEKVNSSSEESMWFTQIKAKSKDSFVESLTTEYSGEIVIGDAYTGLDAARDCCFLYKGGNLQEYVGALASDGKYTVTAELISGYAKVIDYYVDTEYPTISVKGNKVTCKDKKKNNYASGIKSIKINGKKAKNGAKVKKGDKIVVEDKAGNIKRKTIG